MQFIKAKSILSKVKNAPDNWFGLTYNMNLYRGCQHQCIYCDSRSECYRINDFSKIQVKENAIDLLHKELKSKQLKGTIGTGSMNDPYMPIEAEVLHMQKALEVIYYHKFPVHILTKNILVLRDIELIKAISKTYAVVSFTITTTNNELSKVIEPAASLPSERFEAIRELSNSGINCGVYLMPVLPFITDSYENIVGIVEKAKSCGAKFIVGSMGMTLRDRQRDYYYEKLEKYYPGLKAKYLARYGNQYGIGVPEAMVLKNAFEAKCNEVGLNTKIEPFDSQPPKQLSLF